MASPTIAANAYANLARIMDTAGVGQSPEGGGQSFGAILKDADFRRRLAVLSFAPVIASPE